ncbi:CGNR zinc finger domain-containing protein [Kribbella sp. CA-253562]|uniref:CGNR zinc finger domain-containing protein n=1 Tax=Kribbella sp. CA-253562 TaxID=3239942 RepID=UPI003D8CD7C9
MTQWTDDHFIAGHVVLDFANTVYRRTPELGADLFDSGEALAGWITYAGLLPTTPYADDVVLREARTLRSLFWQLFDAQYDAREVPTEVLGRLLDAARETLAGDVSLAPDGTLTPRDVQGACAVLAFRGIELVLNPPDRPVRRCDRCGWFFLDHSRGRRRRWCSMKTCGNQAKAARYRAAHA